MNRLNEHYDTDEKRGCFVYSILLGVAFGVIYLLVDESIKETFVLVGAAVLVLIGFRWLVATILDWIYA